MATHLDSSSWQPRIDIREFHYPNGLTLLVVPEHRLPIVSFQVHYGVGARHERQGITGISHLFEHLMFRGSKELGPEEFSRVIQAKGGEVNAFTSTDNTSYFENLPAEHLELAIRLEAERLQHLSLTEDNFAAEREVVRSERKLRTVDSPFGLPLEQLYSLAYTHHPYQWMVIGRDRDLQTLTLADCLEYHRLHYTAANIVITVAGDVDPETARTLVEKYFGSLPASPRPPDTATPEPPQRGERRAVYKKVSQVEAFLAGFHIPPLKDPDIYAILLLSGVLGMGKASRFHQRFVRPGKAIEIDVESTPPPFTSQDPGLLLILGVAAPGQDLAALEQETWEEIDQIRTRGVSPEELARVKKLYKSQFVRVMANNFYRGLLAGLFRVKTGETDLVNQILENYARVTPTDLQAVARRYLSPDNRSVVIIQPVSQEENAALGEVC